MPTEVGIEIAVVKFNEVVMYDVGPSGVTVDAQRYSIGYADAGYFAESY